MNRFNLPDINFLEKDPDAIETDILFYISDNTGLTLNNADPRRKFVQALVLYIVQERNNLDYALKQNLLAYAEDEFLDHKGEDVETPRLGDKAAVTTMELTLEDGRVDVLTVLPGTRFLVGDSTFFATVDTTTVPVGQNSLQLLATCMETGEVGNGYLPGEITNLVDPIPWVKEVKNITTSAGGVEIEDNDPYAERIRIAPESFSVAGPDGAYEYWAKTTSQEISDVYAFSQSDGVVDIRVLLQDGNLPTQELLDEVLAVCSDKKVRPLTDKVEVNFPDMVLYDVDVQYWVLGSNASLLASIQTQVENAFNEYLVWQRSKLGRDIDLSELIARLKDAGASRVAVNSPMFLGVEKYQVAKESIINLGFGGLVDG
jgi:phage-related baseplate assembly protein